MTRLAIARNAVNLAQGFPDFPAPDILKKAAHEAIDAEFNQYSVTWGARSFRQAISGKYRRHYGIEVDPDREVTACCGATEGMIASLLAVVNAGDEVVMFEPYYENYGPDTDLCGAVRKIVSLRAPDWSFDPDELRKAFSSRTKAIIVTTPNNPTGKVFTRQELTLIADLCQQHDVICITDEIYEHILYDGAVHTPILSIPGVRDRAILVNSMSKTYSVTGWRVGWILAAPDLTDSIRKVHDFLTVHAPHPLQIAGVTALGLPDSYYDELATAYRQRRNHLLDVLSSSGFHCHRPQGAYYVMADISRFGFNDDTTFALHLLNEAGVAAVPGSSFFSNPALGRQLIRFCFCKKYETLEEVRHRLRKGGGDGGPQ
ncbi:MAG: aminotransferase class I/II-fold pyridoxal phosphate-dependent enzyme [Bryobacteraceae bacterium]|nr:aminotransferase class I/II-fold pyridoxal phosphate-dependent enzyme [Bryobacteraceae bacterium]